MVLLLLGEWKLNHHPIIWEISKEQLLLQKQVLWYSSWAWFIILYLSFFISSWVPQVSQLGDNLCFSSCFVKYSSSIASLWHTSAQQCGTPYFGAMIFRKVGLIAILYCQIVFLILTVSFCRLWGWQGKYPRNSKHPNNPYSVIHPLVGWDFVWWLLALASCSSHLAKIPTAVAMNDAP